MSTPIESPPGGWGYAKENPMTAPDSPTPEVRDEWVGAAADVLAEMYPGIGINVEALRAALAAVVPLIEEAVRAEGGYGKDAAEVRARNREHLIAAHVKKAKADVGERIAAAIRDIAAKPILHGDHEWKRGAVDGLERAAVVAENGGDRIARAVATGDEGGQ